jgi:hypothetical protein
LIGAAAGGTAGGVIAENNGESFWKGFGVGAIVGGGIGLGASSVLSGTTGKIGGIFKSKLTTSTIHSTTTVGWNIGSNALITANINIASSTLQGRNFNAIFNSGLVGLGAGAIGGGIGGAYHKGKLNLYEGVFSQRAIKATNYITGGLNGFGDRLVSTLDNGESLGQALFNGLVGAGEGLYFAGMGNRFSKASGPLDGKSMQGLAGRYISSAATQIGTSVPGLGLAVSSVHGGFLGLRNLSAASFALGVGKDRLGLELLGKGALFLSGSILNQRLAPRYTASIFYR